jgi:hypothetical protein
MIHMHHRLLVSIVIAGAGCTFRLPAPGTVGIPVRVSTRVEARVDVQVQQTIVPLQGAPVVEFFGIPLEGAQDVVFVLDCSGSMENPALGQLAQLQATPPPSAPPPPPGAPPPPPAAPVQRSKLDVAKSELIDALQRLPVGTRMNIVFFSSDIEAFAPTVIPLDEAARATAIAFVQEREPETSTALAPAMRTAFLMPARRIVLLSDGLGNVGGNADAVLHDAREAIHGGVRIDTIGLGSGQDGALLGTLANDSGGLYQAL